MGCQLEWPVRGRFVAAQHISKARGHDERHECFIWQGRGGARGGWRAQPGVVVGWNGGGLGGGHGRSAWRWRFDDDRSLDTCPSQPHAGQHRVPGKEGDGDCCGWIPQPGAVRRWVGCKLGREFPWSNWRRTRFAPVAVEASSTTSPLFLQTVVAISAGGNHSLALRSDGRLAAWGAGTSGQMGSGAALNSPCPGAVDMQSGSSALFGFKVFGMSAGSSGSHNLAIHGGG